MPLILFGGKNTGLKGGTFLKVTGGSLARQTGGTGNRPFNDMWLALAPIRRDSAEPGRVHPVDGAALGDLRLKGRTRDWFNEVPRNRRRGRRDNGLERMS